MSASPGSPQAQTVNAAYARPTRMGLAERGLPPGRSNVMRVVCVWRYSSLGVRTTTSRYRSCALVVTVSRRSPDVAWTDLASGCTPKDSVS